MSIRSYLRYSLGSTDTPAERSLPPEGAAGDYKHYIFALLSFVLALLSKTVTATMPAVVLLVLWWKKSAPSKRDLALLSPFFILGAGFGLMTAWLEYSHVGARGASWDLSVLERVLVAGRSVWFYLQKTLWPASLTFNYPRWDLDGAQPWQFLFPLSAAGSLLALWWWRRRIGRGPFVAAAFFAGTLSPALGFFNVYPMRYSFVADHFIYLAVIGPLCLVVALAAQGPWPAILKHAAGAGVIVILSVLTWHQSALYRNEETLWQDTARKNPASWMAHTNLGVLLMKQQRFEEAIPYLERSVEIDPRQPESYYNLGLVRVRLKELETAVALFEKAIDRDPTYSEAYNNLGGVRYMKGDVHAAIDSFRKSLSLKPWNAQAHNNLGLALMDVGNIREAIAQFQEALRIKPNYLEARNNLTTALNLASRRAGAR